MHQKRLPVGAPPWVETVRVHFPRYNRDADELCVTELARVIWAVQMSTVEFHPWNSRTDDTEKPDEWRIDLDPMPECDFATVQRVARSPTRCSTSSARSAGRRPRAASGMHIYVRIEPEHGFKDVRRGGARVRARGRAAGAGRCHDDVVAQGPRPGAAVRRLQPERPRPHDRGGLLGARGSPTARVSTPIRWDEVDDVDPHDFTIETVPARFAELGDLHDGIDQAVFGIAAAAGVGRARRARGRRAAG